MSSWQDDLPPIPADRIRRDVIWEGQRRRAQRRARRRETLMFAGLGAVAVAIVGVIAAAVMTAPRQGDDGDDAADEAASEATEAPAATEAEATTGPGGTDAAGPETTEAEGADATAAGDTEPTEDTGATEETTAATEGAASTLPDHTTIGGSVTHDGVSVALLPVSPAVHVDPPVIFEAPVTGTTCDPTTVSVRYERFNPIPGIPLVHWQVADVTGEAPMTIGERPNVAQATIGPFPAETLGAGVAHELLIFITTSGDAGVLRAPVVVLRDCG